MSNGSGINLFSPIHALEIAFEEVMESANGRDMAAGIILGLRAACLGYENMLSSIDQEAARLAEVGRTKTTERAPEKAPEKPPTITEEKPRRERSALPARA